jgi:3-hydroxyisobutyrate dehydrogenase
VITETGDTVAVVGLGNLGQSIGLNLLEHGWRVSAIDRDQRRVEDLVRQGATASDAKAAADSRFICFVVPDDRAIRSVLDAGLIENLTPGHVVLVHSTVLPERARELAALLEKKGGATYLDVPVSGGAERARTGELTLFVGGPSAGIARSDELLSDIGSQRFVMGEVGAASATKLAHQLILFAAVAGVHEGLRLTRAFGVEEEAVLGAINAGLAETWAGRNWGFFDGLSADYDTAGVELTDRPWFKDLHEVVEAAQSASLDLPVARLLAEVVPDAIEQHARSVSEKEGAAR